MDLFTAQQNEVVQHAPEFSQEIYIFMRRQEDSRCSAACDTSIKRISSEDITE